MLPAPSKWICRILAAARAWSISILKGFGMNHRQGCKNPRGDALAHVLGGMDGPNVKTVAFAGPCRFTKCNPA
jgi:hypothetical protein